MNILHWNSTTVYITRCTHVWEYSTHCSLGEVAVNPVFEDDRFCINQSSRKFISIANESVRKKSSADISATSLNLKR